MKQPVLDRQVTVETLSVTKDGFGAEVKTWAPLVTTGSPAVAVKFWAEVLDEMPSRSEVFKGELVTARNRTRIRMRYRSDIDSSMRVKVHGDVDQLFQIIGGPAMVGGRKQYIELLCETYSTAGA